MENEEMGEPIKLYRNGEMIETVSPSVAIEWQAQGWNLTPDMMLNAAPDELPAVAPELEPAHWAADMLNHVEPEPTQRKPGRPKKTQ